MGISFEQVSHKYRGVRRKDITIALEDINLNINDKDEFIAIVGKTGSGKTTLISHMNGLLLPTEGKVILFDKILTKKKNKNPKLKPIRKRIGFVFQFPEYQLFEENVYKDIIFAPKNFGFGEDEIKQNLKEVLNLLNIDKELLKKSPFNLSGGQMRKVAIAGILAYNPDVLILDEPTRGLDPISQDEIMEMFNKIHKDMHKTIIMITHDMDLMYKYANRVVVMKDAKIAYDGNKEELFSNDEYKQYHLEKPELLNIIDNLNLKLNLNIPYSVNNKEDLITYLLEVYKNE